MEKKIKYYSLKKIKELHCQYNFIIGERSNGKTYAVLKEILDNYFNKREQGAVVRRWQDDFKGKRALQMFAPLHTIAMRMNYYYIIFITTNS